MNLADYLISETKDRGKTSKDKGHSHTFAVDRNTGHGATSKDADHNHKIRKFIVEKVNDHIHRLLDLDKGFE